MVANHTILKADGAVILHDPIQPAQHTCDDPDNPCYTGSQMLHYFKADTHGFHHLSTHYVIPEHFRVLAVHAHQRMVRQGLALDVPGGWWAGFRDDIHCAGGTGEIYWGCPGGVNEADVKAMDSALNHVTRVVLFCGTMGIIGLVTGGPSVALGTGGPCFIAAWLGI